jgi:hypothetical protein
VHVYLITGIMFTVAMALLASLVFRIGVDTLATILKWSFGALLVLALFVRARRSKRDEERHAKIAEQIERYRGRH